MGSKKTELQLSEVTDYRRFEAFCNDLMVRCGYPAIQPLGGSRDKGRDAILFNKIEKTVTIFFYSARQDWEKKLYEDLEKVRRHGHQCDGVVYVTNRNVSTSDFDRVLATVLLDYGWELDIYSLARVATLVELHSELKQLHPEIFFLESGGLPERPVEPLDYAAYADRMINAFRQWQERYTPLLAEYLEFDLYAVNIDPATTQRVNVLDLPNVGPVVALLGESGAGKTTTLWKLVLGASERLKAGGEGGVPVYVELRNWSPVVGLRALVQNQFAGLGTSEEAVERELEAGNCVLLIDGLNELPPGNEPSDAAGRDIRAFFGRYSLNKFLFTCRTADYDPEFINVLPDLYPPTFETQRLSRNQVAEYVNRYFTIEPAKAEGFLESLDLSDERKWSNDSSFVHLVRIPLYLQLTLAEYEHSGEIPANKGTMLRSFIIRLIGRDSASQASKLPPDEKSEVLSGLALAGAENKYYLTLPKSLIKSVIVRIIRELRGQGMISQSVVVTDVFREVFSTNFLVVNRGADPARVSLSWDTAHWLHQIIHDYFLAVEIIKVLVVPGTDKVDDLCLLMVATPGVFDQPCQMALGLLGVDRGQDLYMILIYTSTDLGRRVLSGLPEDQAKQLVLNAVERMTDEPNWDQHLVSTVSMYLDCVSVVSRLSRTFKMNSNSAERKTLAKIMVEIAIQFQGTFAAKRALDVCEAWVANHDDTVSFYAAKALWGRDRGRASETFRRLLREGSPEVRGMVQRLAEQWKID